MIVIISFIVSAIVAGLLADFIGVWKKTVIGSVAAFCVVISGYVSAPIHKQIASVVWLIVAAIAAWVLSGNSSYPEDQPTLTPLLVTYSSGLIALLICTVCHKTTSKNKLRHAAAGCVLLHFAL